MTLAYKSVLYSCRYKSNKLYCQFNIELSICSGIDTLSGNTIWFYFIFICRTLKWCWDQDNETSQQLWIQQSITFFFFVRSRFFFLNTSRYLFGATRIFLSIHEVDIQMLHVQLMVWLFFVFEVVALLWLPRELPQELSIFLWLFFIGNDFDDDE